MSENTTNRPVHIIRRKGVKVSIFMNSAGEGEFAKVTVHKIYRDKDGNWKTTTSYGRDDLPVVSLLTTRAWEWVLEREAGSAAETNDGEKS